jgi:hypothetical protein
MSTDLTGKNQGFHPRVASAEEEDRILRLRRNHCHAQGRVQGRKGRGVRFSLPGPLASSSHCSYTDSCHCTSCKKRGGSRTSLAILGYLGLKSHTNTRVYEVESISVPVPKEDVVITGQPTVYVPLTTTSGKPGERQFYGV